MDELVRAAVEVFFSQHDLGQHDFARMIHASDMLAALIDGDSYGAEQAFLEMVHYDAAMT